MSVHSELPPVSEERRAAMLSLPAEPQVHRDLLAELGFLDDVEVAPPPRARPAAASARVVCWNAERGGELESAALVLAEARPDLLLLCELDCGMARSGQRHTARELSRRLGCGYVFGVEYLELGLGDERERTRCAGQRNRIGYHGAAIASPSPIRAPELVRLERSGRWFDGTLGERRVGGRMALLGSLTLAGIDVTVASVHLESHSDPDERSAQLARLLEAIERRAPGGPALIGGDLNTSSLSRQEMQDRDRLAAALRDDAQRLRNPVPHEPLFRMAEALGYDWRACNCLNESTQRVRSADASVRGSLRLDWFLTRGLLASEPTVIAAVAPDCARALSDHEMISLTVEPA